MHKRFRRYTKRIKPRRLAFLILSILSGLAILFMSYLAWAEWVFNSSPVQEYGASGTLAEIKFRTEEGKVFVEETQAKAVPWLPVYPSFFSFLEMITSNMAYGLGLIIIQVIAELIVIIILGGWRRVFYEKRSHPYPVISIK